MNLLLMMVIYFSITMGGGLLLNFFIDSRDEDALILFVAYVIGFVYFIGAWICYQGGL